jgi:hypothetical protein
MPAVFLMFTFIITIWVLVIIHPLLLALPIHHQHQPHPSIPRTAPDMPLQEFARLVNLGSPLKRKLLDVGITNTRVVPFLDPQKVRQDAQLNVGKFGEFMFACQKMGDMV